MSIPLSFLRLLLPKTRKKKRDHDAHSVKKGNAWYFGYKAHVGVDKDSGLVHTVEVTAANEHDVTMTAKLLKKKQSTATADISVRKSEKTQSSKTKMVRKSGTTSIAFVR